VWMLKMVPPMPMSSRGFAAAPYVSKAIQVCHSFFVWCGGITESWLVVCVPTEYQLDQGDGGLSLGGCVQESDVWSGGLELGVVLW
jgi:hypothetical protein